MHTPVYVIEWMCHDTEFTNARTSKYFRHTGDMVSSQGIAPETMSLRFWLLSATLAFPNPGQRHGPI
jgi:hypothetical protein